MERALPDSVCTAGAETDSGRRTSLHGELREFCSRGGICAVSHFHRRVADSLHSVPEGRALGLRRVGVPRCRILCARIHFREHPELGYLARISKLVLAAAPSHKSWFGILVFILADCLPNPWARHVGPN